MCLCVEGERRIKANDSTFNNSFRYEVSLFFPRFIFPWFISPLFLSVCLFSVYLRNAGAVHCPGKSEENMEILLMVVENPSIKGTL